MSEHLKTMGVVSAVFPGTPLGPLRIGGPGLANLLWMWCKQVVFSHEAGCAKVWPVWNQFKPRSFLRGEFRMASYWGLFRKPEHGYVDPGHAKGLPEHLVPKELPSEVSEWKTESGPAHWVIRDLGEPFCSLFPYRDLLRQEWGAMQRRPPEDPVPDRTAVVHIRRGDFRLAGLASDLSETRRFLERFIEETKGMTRKLMTDADAADRSFWEVVPKELVREKPRSALEDLQSMIQANVLYATAESSYSRCAAFFGGMPVEWIGPSELVKTLNALPFTESPTT